MYSRSYREFLFLISPLPNDKILELTELKAFADDKLNVARITISLFDRVENTVGKGENAGYQHFLLFPQYFPKPSSLGCLKSGLCGKDLIYSYEININLPYSIITEEL